MDNEFDDTLMGNDDVGGIPPIDPDEDEEIIPGKLGDDDTDTDDEEADEEY